MFLLFEINGNGITIGQLTDYLSKYIKEYYKLNDKKKNFSIFYAKIGKTDFLDEIKKLKRTRVAEVYFDKSLLGSEALDFSNRTTSIKRNILLTAKAEKNESITEAAIDIFNKFSSPKNAISKVRIYGKDEDNGNVILDTSFIEKIEFLSSTLNMETGEIETAEMITSLKALLKNI